MYSTFRFILLTVLLGSFCSGQEMTRHVAKEGDDITLHWNFKLEEGLDTVRRDEVIIVRVTLGGSVDIPATLTQSVKATVGPEMSGLTVTLLSVNTSSAGVYAFWRDQGAEALQRQLLIVQVKPDKPTLGPTSGPFVVGREITLTCNSASNSRPVNHSLPLTFTWSVTPPVGRQDGNTYVITAPPQQRNTTFNFRCQAREGDLESEDSDTLNLRPEYGPLDVKVTSSPNASSQGEVKVREGQPLTLTCSADCRPGCTVEWKDRKMAVVADRDAYMVTRTGRSHYGAYQCSVRNAFGNDTRNVMVDLQYNASITSLTVNSQAKGNRDTSFAVAENSAVTFDFTVDSNPAPTVHRSLRDRGSEQWSAPTAIALSGPNVRSTDPRQHHFYSGNWSIEKAACSDTKEYRMEARNPLQDDSFDSRTQVNLSVNCSPRPTTPPTQNFGVALGMNQTVEINITAFPRNLTFSLHLNNAAVRPQPLLKTQPLPEPWKITVSFNITVSNQNDYGMYEARFENAHGAMNASIYVRAEGKPSRIESLNITSIVSRAVTLNWKEGFNGGRPQMFRVEFRPHGSQEWSTAVNSVSGGPVTVENLEPGTMYHFRVTASNEFGSSESLEVEANTESEYPNVIVPVVISVIVVVIIAVAVTIFLFKRRQARRDKEEDAHFNLVGNSGASASSPMEEVVYTAVVKKPKKKSAEESSAPIYGVVNKPKKKKTEDVIYENSETLLAGGDKSLQKGDKASPDGNDVSLPSSRHTNDEGLIYMDVEITPSAGKAGKRPLIKVKDSKGVNNNKADSEYVTIDFSKTAPVIPESDEEEEKEKGGK